MARDLMGYGTGMQMHDDRAAREFAVPAGDNTRDVSSRPAHTT